MKKLIVAAMLMIGMTSFAQEAKPMKTVAEREQKMTSEERNQMQLKKLAAELNLDANQQQEMLRIIEERNAKREMVRKEMQARKEKGEKPTVEDRDQRRADMQEFNEGEKAKMKKLLNAEQYTKWEQHNQERKEKMKQARAQREAKAKSQN